MPEWVSLFPLTIQGDPVYAKPTSGGQDDANTYTELTVYEQVGRQGEVMLLWRQRMQNNKIFQKYSSSLFVFL